VSASAEILARSTLPPDDQPSPRAVPLGPPEAIGPRLGEKICVQLYAGSTNEFIQDSIQHEVAKKIGDSFYDFYRYRASISELRSWENSLQALTNQILYSNLRDNGIIIEMQLPLSSSRIDCILTGHDTQKRPQAVLIELKQWQAVESSDFENSVIAVYGGREKAVPHPSVQAHNYATYLKDTNSAFSEAESVVLEACSWLHNMHPEAAVVLRDPKFDRWLSATPMFIANDADRFSKYLKDRLQRGNGLSVLERVTSGRYGPSKKLMEHTAAIIKGEPVYTLLDEQIVAYDAVLSIARRALKKSGHSIVIIRGGPGTGKSVLALNVMATLLKRGINAQHATGSRAFTENLWKTLGTRSKPMFRYFNSYSGAEDQAVDVLVMDEAHRIRSSSNSMYTPKAKRSERAQIDELVEASKVAVFFIDDHQAVRPGEVGSTQMIREAAVRHDAFVFEEELRTQFRCAGSDKFIDWVDQLLEIRKTATTHLGDEEAFEFQVLDEPELVEAVIADRAAAGSSARLTAGFCWPWSQPNADGSLVDDVQIGAFRRPWNARPEATRLAKGIPKALYWATDRSGIGQVGCVYTAQGFEFDYIGVLWGNDLVIRNGIWVGQPQYSRDHVVKTRSGAKFVDCVKNTYRVLLTRGLKGCFVFFQDPETQRFVGSRL
jgi:DUF2075 family protein/predicted kinase